MDIRHAARSWPEFWVCSQHNCNCTSSVLHLKRISNWSTLSSHLEPTKLPKMKGAYVSDLTLGKNIYLQGKWQALSDHFQDSHRCVLSGFLSSIRATMGCFASELAGRSLSMHCQCKVCLLNISCLVCTLNHYMPLWENSRKGLLGEWKYSLHFLLNMTSINRLHHDQVGGVMLKFFTLIWVGSILNIALLLQ